MAVAGRSRHDLFLYALMPRALTYRRASRGQNKGCIYKQSLNLFLKKRLVCFFLQLWFAWILSAVYILVQFLVLVGTLVTMFTNKLCHPTTVFFLGVAGIFVLSGMSPSSGIRLFDQRVHILLRHSDHVHDPHDLRHVQLARGDVGNSRGEEDGKREGNGRGKDGSG